MNEYDGDVAEYLRDTRTRGGVHNTTHIGTMHAGNAAFVSGDHNTITQTSSSGIDPTALLDLVAGLRPMLSTFGAVEPEAKVLVDEMEAQGHTSTPNVGIVRRNVEKLIDMAVPLGLRMVAEWLRFEGQKHGVLPPA